MKVLVRYSEIVSHSRLSKKNFVLRFSVNLSMLHVMHILDKFCKSGKQQSRE